MAPLVDALLDAAPEGRAALLSQLSGGDAARRAELERLVVEREQASSMLDRPAAEQVAGLFDEEAVRVPPSLAERYPVARELGRGGMAVVYLARDLKHGRDVAVKVVRPEWAAATGRERFLREIAIAAQLHHPHIVPLYDSGEADGFLFYVMPYEDGPSLRARLSEEGVLPVADAMAILRDVARALAYAHGRGVVHRDIKPDNVLLSEGSAMVTDFGIAKALTAAASADGARAGLTQTGLGIGTLAYMAPEQVTGDPDTDHRADIYSFGCLAYELFTGNPPFHGMPSHQMAAAQLGKTPRHVTELRADVPEPAAALIARCLEKDPAQRPQGARELLQVLDGVATLPKVIARRRMPRAALVGATLATLVIVVLVAVYFVFRGGRESSIAVLPFTNVGGDSTNQPFSDGIADELTTALGKIAGLTVIARTSAFNLKRQGLDTREIGRKLQVRFVVEGSVQRAGARRRVRADLLDVNTGREVWSDDFEHNAQILDLFTVEDSIIRSIVSQVLPRIPLGAIASSVTPSTRSTEAHDFYLQGRFFAEKRDSASLMKAQHYFERAIEKDSSYALAYGALSEVYIFRWIWSHMLPGDVVPAAKAYASRAIALDSTLGQVHNSLAVIALFYDRDWPTAGREFAAAVRLDPFYSPAHRFRGVYYIATDSLDAAVAEARLAVRLDPFSSLNSVRLISVLFLAGRYQDALEQAHKSFELDPNFSEVHSEFATVYERLGRCDEALAALAKASRRTGNPRKGYLYAKCDRRAMALAEMDSLRADVRAGTFVSHYTFGAIHAALGNEEAAFAELDSAFTERDWMLFQLKHDPALENLHSDPRFAALVRKMGLPR